MKHFAACCLAAFLLFVIPAFALGETAKEITTGVSFETNGKSKEYEEMRDGQLKTYFPLKEKKGWVEIRSEEAVYGVSVMLFDKYGQPLSYDLQVQGNGDEWKTVAQGGEYLVHWHSLEGVKAFRITATCKERLRIAELRMFGEGDRPADAQEWTTIGKCDMMLLTAHPDDEILWFAGLLPTYAGERKLKVQCAVMVPTGGQRKLELLSAIWHCGVTAYPEFIGLIDKNGHAVDKQYALWRGENRVLKLVTAVIRKHQPEVIVTHGEKGEYGHGAHRATCDAAKKCVKYASNEKKFPDSVKAYGTWQVKKLYLHEYEKNVIPCDWSVPLEAFGGKTGYEVAEEAFTFHGSQVRRDWNFEVHGEHDNASFGLYYTTVGEDTGIGDFMEHIDTGSAADGETEEEPGDA